MKETEYDHLNDLSDVELLENVECLLTRRGAKYRDELIRSLNILMRNAIKRERGK